MVDRESSKLIRSKEGPLKNPTAAEKMEHLAALSKGAGEGGRGVKRWGCRPRGPLWGKTPGSHSQDQCLLEREYDSQIRRALKTLEERKPPFKHRKDPPVILFLYGIVCIVGWVLVPIQAGSSPHQPFKWSLIRWEDQQVIQIKETAGPPSFTPTLCELVPIKPCLNLLGFYLCPSSNPGKEYCNWPGHYYCAYWGCETVAPDWIGGKGKDPFLSVGWGPTGCTPPRRDASGGTVSPGNCEHIYLNITKPENPGWTTGKTWGMRYWEPGTDRGGLIYIKREELQSSPVAVGPNVVLKEDPKPEGGSVNVTKDGRDNSTEKPVIEAVSNNPLLEFNES